MTFRFSRRSETNLIGVHPDLVKVVRLALGYSAVDFGVFEGLRSDSRQRELVKAGASKTMNSRHLTGHAVDLVPFVDGQMRWEWQPIFSIAVAVDKAATQLQIPIRWGGVWDKVMTEYGGSAEAMQSEVDAYCKRHPGPDFIDGPHYELDRRRYP